MDNFFYKENFEKFCERYEKEHPIPHVSEIE